MKRPGTRTAFQVSEKIFFSVSKDFNGQGSEGGEGGSDVKGKSSFDSWNETAIMWRKTINYSWLQ